ncbi:MAG TPA: hypothetical protein VKU02_24270 [Gemmataceae bacterium]|nr:hypothetical protein [Gemmataceae bacterium]
MVIHICHLSPQFLFGLGAVRLGKLLKYLDYHIAKAFQVRISVRVHGDEAGEAGGRLRQRSQLENDCFNTLATHWGLDHCFQHDPTAIVNFVLTLFLVYVLLQCFWQRNLKAPLRTVLGTLLGLAEELRRSLGSPERAPWYKQLARAP